MPALRVRGVMLPDGDERDMWVLGDRLTFTRPAGPVETVVEGGYLLPGLVDAHSHAGHDESMAFSPGVLRHPSRVILRGTVVR